MVKQTKSMRSVDFRFDYVIILYVAMFDFATMSQNGILCWNIQFTFCAYCPLVPYVEGIFFNKRKQETRME